MDIYRFFNSRDVANHLREIGYEFSMPEAAFVVYLSLGATLDEKVATWREIAEEMPDCPMGKSPWLERIESSRAFLIDYADMIERELETFCKQDRSVFRLQREEPGLGWQDDGSIFGSAEACLSYMQEHWGNRADGSIMGFRVAKTKVDRPDRGRDDWLYLNWNMEVTDVDCIADEGPALDLKLQFDGMWFAIPTPFERGDIVRDARHPNNGPFVLDWLPTWGRDELLANGFSEGEQIVEWAGWRLAHWLEGGDISDMICGGFGISEDGDVYRDHMGWTYLDLVRAGEVPREGRWARSCPHT